MPRDLPWPKLGLKVPFPTTRKFSFISADVSNVDSERSIRPTDNTGEVTPVKALILNRLVRLVEVISESAGH
jgi:hypothetical protein